MFHEGYFNHRLVYQNKKDKNQKEGISPQLAVKKKKTEGYVEKRVEKEENMKSYSYMKLKLFWRKEEVT